MKRAISHVGITYRGASQLGLALLTLAVFSSALRNGFVNLDDPSYLQANETVREFDVARIFAEPAVGNYHPLTLLSLGLEHRLFGLDPFAFHLSNVLLHVLNVWLVVAFLRRLVPDSDFVPLLCGALFAVHPLHVESVAWISARKDLLSTAFFLLTLLAYARLRERPGAFWYVAALGVFTAALLSKVMAITAPLVMLALDARAGRRLGAGALFEKVPFLALAAAAIALNRSAHTEQSPLHAADLATRLFVGAHGLAFYLSKSLMPRGLSAYYDVAPVSRELYHFAVAFAGAALLARCARGGDRRDYLFGALFFLITIAPVLKIIPFGGSSLFNDRYTYLPSVGLFLCCGLPFRGIGAWRPRARFAVFALCTAVVAALSVASYARCRVWYSSESVWRDVLRRYPDTPAALIYLGRHYAMDLGDVDRARPLLEQAVRLYPDDGLAAFHLGYLYAHKGWLPEAERLLERSLALDPLAADRHYNVAVFYAGRGNDHRAVELYERALELKPDFAAAHHELGLLYLRMGRSFRAKISFEHAIAARPDFGAAYAQLGLLELREGDREAGLRLLETARRLGEPVDPDALGRLRERLP